MQSPCQINEYETIANKIKTLLKLEKEPVAVKLFLTEDEAKETLKKADDKIRHCERIFKAAAEGVSCYATVDEQQCQGGAAVLGLRDLPEAVKTGKKYMSLGRFASLGSAKHEVDQIPMVDNIMEAVGYAPLKDAKFKADVIVLYAKPEQAMRVVQANGFILGKRFTSSFAGIQSMCADVVAQPFVNKEPNMSLGCDGSRKSTSIAPDELVIGLTAENIGCMLNSVDSILG